MSFHDISFEIIEFIASSITENVRDLEGALIRLLAFASLKRQDITMNLAKQVILDIMGSSTFQKITIDHVLKVVSKEMRITEEEISNFPEEYKTMMKGSLSKRQIEILDGSPLKSHEGMVFGGMYADWKRRKGYDEETV